RRTEGHRVQRPLRRPRDPAGDDAAAVGPARPGRGRDRRSAGVGAGALGPAAGGRRGDGRGELSRHAAHRRPDRQLGRPRGRRQQGLPCGHRDGRWPGRHRRRSRAVRVRARRDGRRGAAACLRGGGRHFLAWRIPPPRHRLAGDRTRAGRPGRLSGRARQGPAHARWAMLGTVSTTGTATMPQLSILELGRVREGGDRRTALDEARALARHAEGWGYRRFWIAEHHNMPAVTTAATSLVIAHVAAGTSTIRVGAGGIMLPNHAPYIIAEQFGTLATLFPGRIDLGLGRAPGTDQGTVRALRRDPGSADRFPQDVLELQAWLGPVAPGQRIEAVPGSGTEVPLWILGSSLFGAQLAAELGLPYGFASHFAPQMLDQALSVYRSRFRPSAQLDRPYVLAGINVIAAPTDDEARYLATSQQMSFAGIFRGERRLTQPPIDDIE